MPEHPCSLRNIQPNEELSRYYKVVWNMRDPDEPEESDSTQTWHRMCGEVEEEMQRRGMI